MKNPTILNYLYFCCSKKKDPKCSQRSLTVSKLEECIETELSRFEIPEEFQSWAIQHLNELHEHRAENMQIIRENLSKEINKTQLSIDNLLSLKISAKNSDGSQISDEEYTSKRQSLFSELKNLEKRLKEINVDQSHYVELTEKTFDFACHARYWFEHEDAKVKSLILQTLGNNLNVQDKKSMVYQTKTVLFNREEYGRNPCGYKYVSNQRKDWCSKQFVGFRAYSF